MKMCGVDEVYECQRGRWKWIGRVRDCLLVMTSYAFVAPDSGMALVWCSVMAWRLRDMCGIWSWSGKRSGRPHDVMMPPINRSAFTSALTLNLSIWSTAPGHPCDAMQCMCRPRA